MDKKKKQNRLHLRRIRVLLQGMRRKRQPPRKHRKELLIISRGMQIALWDRMPRREMKAKR